MNQDSNHYMAEEPIGRLMLRFSIPCIMSLLVSALTTSWTRFSLAAALDFWEMEPPMWYFP